MTPPLTPAQSAILRHLEGWTLDLAAASLAWRDVSPMAAHYAERLVVPRFRTTRKGRAYLELLTGIVRAEALPWSPAWVLRETPPPRRPARDPSGRRTAQIGYYATAEAAERIASAARNLGTTVSGLCRIALRNTEPASLDPSPAARGPDAVHVACRLTPAEYREAAARARESGVSPSAWLRYAVDSLTNA